MSFVASAAGACSSADPCASSSASKTRLASYGLDLRGTDVVFAKPFKDGKNSIQALDMEVSLASVARHSDADAATVMAFQEFGAENMEEAVAIAQIALFAPPTMEVAERTAKLNTEMCKAMGLTAAPQYPPLVEYPPTRGSGTRREG